MFAHGAPGCLLAHECSFFTHTPCARQVSLWQEWRSQQGLAPWRSTSPVHITPKKFNKITQPLGYFQIDV